MPIYLHRPTRSVTLSRPYHLGAASARRHPVPMNAIPCLNYRKALEAEEEIEKNAAEQNSIFPLAKVESVEENNKKASLDPNEVREYCQKLFVFKQETVRKFKSYKKFTGYAPSYENAQSSQPQYTFGYYALSTFYLLYWTNLN